MGHNASSAVDVDEIDGQNGSEFDAIIDQGDRNVVKAKNKNRRVHHFSFKGQGWT